MKLRGQLNMLLLLMAVIPFFATFLFSLQVEKLIDDQSDTLMSSMITAKSVGKALSRFPSVFLDKEKSMSFIHDKKKEDMDIALYSKDRTLIYDSDTSQKQQRHFTPQRMMRDLYKFHSDNTTQVYKEPIFHEDEIVGFFELRFHQQSIKKDTLEVYLISAAFFLLVVAATLFFVQYWFKRNMLRPFALMQQEMEEIGFRKQKVISKPKRRRTRTEVAQLMHDFTTMSARLKIASEQQKKAEENQRRFIGAISHDLRTPLTSIRAYAEGMLVHDEQREAYADVILAKTTHMQRLVDDLLVYSQIKSTSFSLSEKLVDGEELAEVLFDGYKEQWAEFRFEISFFITPCELYADVDRLVQVIDNLVTNAVRYSSRGGVIKLCATNQREALPTYLSEKKEGLYFFVEDEGKGIPLDAQKHLFDSFYQVETARQQTPGTGIGLGLAICKELVEQHGGEIGVKSTVAGGSTFYFMLPCTILREDFV
ncbi:sensor histidine kinase [Shouchella lonarensis]|uniref:histidine kinase n=1 Tax=Shouchella lonarensis TaxID=1464122 RepID=A0A1G6IZ38_9BACI|nr:HAMP domain-containing sensor histidine kinase [Shouchella lonarensis]SDC11764.1 Signal transduction histidine kinase [Shouchella lonarensis]